MVQRTHIVEKQLWATVRNRSLGHRGGVVAGDGEEPVPWIRYTKDSQPLPLDSPVHSLQPGDSGLVHTWKDEPLREKWKGPYTVLLISHTAAKIEGHKNWIQHSRLKTVPAPSSAEQWTVQPADSSSSDDLRLKDTNSGHLNAKIGPPRYWRPWVGKTLVIINWVTLLFSVLVFPNCAYREHNSFVSLAHHVATLTNQTDCWAYAPTPLSPKTGMPLHMLPLTLAELATTKEQERTDSPFWNKTSLQQATYQDQEYSVAVLTEGVLCFTRNQSDHYGRPVGKSSCVITQWADGYWIKTKRGGQQCGCNGSSPFRETLTNNLTTKEGFGNITCRPVNISNVASQWWVYSGPYGECNLNGTIRNAPTCTNQEDGMPP
ncbi:uncharacterized protein LOC142069099 [Caretta caretta]|uniref:uncharacterized protein LOC142069099 n=1 Tax=Caretta caretta TaxID=8467 RepID=UPI003F4C5B1F